MCCQFRLIVSHPGFSRCKVLRSGSPVHIFGGALGLKPQQCWGTELHQPHILAGPSSKRHNEDSNLQPLALRFTEPYQFIWHGSVLNLLHINFTKSLLIFGRHGMVEQLCLVHAHRPKTYIPLTHFQKRLLQQGKKEGESDISQKDGESSQLSREGSLLHFRYKSIIVSHFNQATVGGKRTLKTERASEHCSCSFTDVSALTWHSRQVGAGVVYGSFGQRHRQNVPSCQHIEYTDQQNRQCNNASKQTGE